MKLKIKYAYPEVYCLTPVEYIYYKLEELYTLRRLNKGNIDIKDIKKLNDISNMLNSSLSYMLKRNDIAKFIEKYIWSKTIAHSIFLEFIDVDFLLYCSERCLMHLRTYRHLSPAYYQSTQTYIKSKINSNDNTIVMSIFSKKYANTSFQSEIEIPDDRFIPKGVMVYGYLKTNMREWNHILRQRLLDPRVHNETRYVCYKIKNIFILYGLDYLLSPDIRDIKINEYEE